MKKKRKVEIKEKRMDRRKRGRKECVMASILTWKEGRLRKMMTKGERKEDEDEGEKEERKDG